MDSFLKADIFFFIATVSLILVAIVMIIAFFYLIKILRDIQYVSKRIRQESDSLLSDIHDLREFVKKEGQHALDLKQLFGGLLRMVVKKKRMSKTRKEKKE